MHISCAVKTVCDLHTSVRGSEDWMPSGNARTRTGHTTQKPLMELNQENTWTQALDGGCLVGLLVWDLIGGIGARLKTVFLLPYWRGFKGFGGGMGGEGRERSWHRNVGTGV